MSVVIWQRNPVKSAMLITAKFLHVQVLIRDFRWDNCGMSATLSY
jgi:hypothetical protein